MQHEIECEVVGHKTLSDGKGGYYHEPLRRDEAEEILRRCDVEAAKRKELMPDEEAARRVFCDAFQRLKELGWNDACYCPKDGSMFEVIEAGSSGIHKCHYEGKWPTGSYWIHSEGDLWPSHPVLFRMPKGRA